MEKLTIGLNFYGGHDTSVCSYYNNEFFALSQERVSRIKHDSIFPIDAIWEFIKYANIDTKSIKRLRVGVATKSFQYRELKEYSYELSTTLRKLLKDKDKPLFIKEFEQKKQRLKNSPKWRQLLFFLSSKLGRKYLKMQLLGKQKPLEDIIKRHMKQIFPNALIDISFYEHHLTHAISAFYSSNFDKSFVFTFDGEGDGSFSKLFWVENNDFKEITSSQNLYIENMKQYEFIGKGKASIGSIYSVFTYLLGFSPNADEGKVEALAAFGDHNNFLYEDLMKSFKIDKDLKINLQKDVLEEIFSQKNLDKIFDKLSKEDISASVQRYSEDVILSYLKLIKEKFGNHNICLAGGVSANVIINKKIYEQIFENIFIVPAMGDEGLAQGAFLLKNGLQRFPQMPYFGTSYKKSSIKHILKQYSLNYKYIGENAYIKAAKEITNGKIGAIFQGRCEFGPRALGNRSIIADVRDKDIQKKINQSIKKRPLFQPFCPSILEEERERLFDKAYNNKHMTIAFRLKEKYKDDIPGAIHIDNTARVQFVSFEDNPNYYNLIKEVKKITGFGVIINTSFNKHGRTIVLTPEDAIRDFLDTNLDFLVMEGFWIER